MQHWIWIGDTNLHRTAEVNNEKYMGSVYYHILSDSWFWAISKYTDKELVRVGYGNCVTATQGVSEIEQFLGAQK